jgi:hypothetical protein
MEDRKTQYLNNLLDVKTQPTPQSGEVLTSLGAGLGYVFAVGSGGGSATDVVISDTNANSTLYPVLTSGVGLSQPLNIDSITEPFSINPSTGTFKVANTINIINDGVSTNVNMGVDAGSSLQGTDNTAIGRAAGQTQQGASCVAIGGGAGNGRQGALSIAVGNLAGSDTQGRNAVALGCKAGATQQGDSTVAVGHQAGEDTQGANSTAVGSLAGQTSQSKGAVALGMNAGNRRQGAYSIAIGMNAAPTTQPANCICINSSGVALNPAGAGLFIDSLRGVALGVGVGVVVYNPTTKELNYSTT